MRERKLHVPVTSIVVNIGHDRQQSGAFHHLLEAMLAVIADGLASRSSIAAISFGPGMECIGCTSSDFASSPRDALCVGNGKSSLSLSGGAPLIGASFGRA